MTEALASVSVIVPCYRCTATIRRAIDSVASQTLRPAEIILVDDCSGDATLDELYGLQLVYPKGWIKVVALEKNSGPAHARNTGWRTATQPYIAFLDADDSWHPQKIEVQFQWMSAHPQVVLTGHGSLVTRDRFDNEKVATEEKVPQVVTRKQLLLSNRFSTPTIMLKRDLQHRFDIAKRRGEDYLLWLEICLAESHIFRFPADLAFIHKSRFGESGLSGDLSAMQLGEIDAYRKIYLKGYINSFEYGCVCIFSWVKYFRRRLITLRLAPTRLK